MGVVMPDLELALFLAGIVALVAGVGLWLGPGPALVVLGIVLIVLSLAIANRVQAEDAAADRAAQRGRDMD